MSTTDDASQPAPAAQREAPGHPARSRGAVRAALRVALTYAVVGAAWILLSDEVVERVAGAGTARLTTIQTAKGWFFVVATAALIYFLIRGDARRIESIEHARRDSERRYQRLAELSPDGIFVQTGGVVRYANRALAEILGVDDPRQLVGRDALGLIHPDYHELVRARAHTMLVEGQDVPLFEERMLRADGGEVWVEVAAGPFEFDGTTGVLAVVRDVSERITSRAARARLEAERAGLLERLQLVLDRMPIACIVTDTAFRFTYWNAAAEQMFGYAFEEVKGRHPFGLITPPAVQAQVREIFRALEEAPGPVSAVSANTTKDGRTITCAWVNSAYHDRDGRFLGIISMAQDMSESLRAQESVRRSEQMLARAQAIANLGSWELDLASGDVKWSAEMYRIFGQDPRTLHPTREVVYRFLQPDDGDRG